MNPPEKTMTLRELIQLIRRKILLIAAITVTTSSLAFIYGLVKTPYYRSTVSMYPVSDEGNLNASMNGLQGIASAFGYSVGSGSSAFYIPDLVNSRRLLRSVLDHQWQNEKFDRPVDLVTYLEVEKSIVYRLKLLIRDVFTDIPDQTAKIYEISLEELSELISVKEEDSGLFTISVLSEEPRMSADIANYIAGFIQTYIEKYLNVKATRNREFIDERLRSAEDDLRLSEEQLTEFRQQNPIALDTPEKQLERARLLRNVQVNQEVYVTLRQQFELAKLEELKEKPAVNVLDPGEPPVKSAKPRRLLILFTTFMVTVLLSVSGIALNESYLKN